MTREVFLTKKINKYETKLSDLRDKIKGWISRGKHVSEEQKEKEEVYKGKLAYYRKLAGMRGGAISDSDQTLIDQAIAKLDADAVDADETKMVAINAQREAINSFVREGNIGDDERNILNTIINGAEVTIEEPVGEPAEEPAVEMEESKSQVAPIPPPKPNTEPVFISGTPSVTWTEDEQQNFLDLLNKYGDDLLKLVDSLQTLAPQQQQTIANIADKLNGLSKQLQYKDEVIKKYIQIFSSAQSGLSQYKATAEGIIDTSEVDSTLETISNVNNKNMLYYSLMTLIHSYLARLKTDQGMKLGDSEYNSVINGITTVFKSGPEELKSVLRNFTKKEFNVNDAENEKIRLAIFNKIKSL